MTSPAHLPIVDAVCHPCRTYAWHNLWHSLFLLFCRMQDILLDPPWSPSPSLNYFFFPGLSFPAALSCPAFSFRPFRIISGLIGHSFSCMPKRWKRALPMAAAVGLVRPSPASLAPYGPSGSYVSISAIFAGGISVARIIL